MITQGFLGVSEQNTKLVRVYYMTFDVANQLSDCLPTNQDCFFFFLMKTNTDSEIKGI